MAQYRPIVNLHFLVTPILLPGNVVRHQRGKRAVAVYDVDLDAAGSGHSEDGETGNSLQKVNQQPAARAGKSSYDPNRYSRTCFDRPPLRTKKLVTREVVFLDRFSCTEMQNFLPEICIGRLVVSHGSGRSRQVSLY